MSNDQPALRRDDETIVGTEASPAHMAGNAERVPPENADPEDLNAEMREHPAAQPPSESHA